MEQLPIYYIIYLTLNIILTYIIFDALKSTKRIDTIYKTTFMLTFALPIYIISVMIGFLIEYVHILFWYRYLFTNHYKTKISIFEINTIKEALRERTGKRLNDRMYRLCANKIIKCYEDNKAMRDKTGNQTNDNQNKRHYVYNKIIRD